MGIKELSLELAAVTMIEQEAKKAKDALRERLKAEMDQIGADRVKAEIEGEQIAYVTTSKPKFKWVIKSDRKFVEWVKAHNPGEIIESVRESSVEHILNKFNYLDDVVIDPNGEIVDWLEGSESEPYLSTRFSADGRETLKNAFQSGQLEFKKIWELEG
jgi:hypothetical protein